MIVKNELKLFNSCLYLGIGSISFQWRILTLKNSYGSRRNDEKIRDLLFVHYCRKYITDIIIKQEMKETNYTWVRRSGKVRSDQSIKCFWGGHYQYHEKVHDHLVLYWSSAFSITILCFLADKKMFNLFLVVFLHFEITPYELLYLSWDYWQTEFDRHEHITTDTRIPPLPTFKVRRKATFSRAGEKSRPQSRVLPLLRDPALSFTPKHSLMSAARKLSMLCEIPC